MNALTRSRLNVGALTLLGTALTKGDKSLSAQVPLLVAELHPSTNSKGSPSLYKSFL